ncbi:hypothetical protein CDAR_263021 [Caerostris darwini]|uniref:Uncharacterized protein n=1 Tax=Caerostris darwini TaxID=1538125 RepID=A0AAV4RVE9_9ARAC|nr:hypothetical protein CDAR_263021 [Caerostris darwini]
MRSSRIPTRNWRVDDGVAFTNLLTCLDSQCLLTDDLLDSLANNLVTWEGHAFLTLLLLRSARSNIICWLIATMSKRGEGRRIKDLSAQNHKFQTDRPKILIVAGLGCWCTVIIEKRCLFI